MIWINKLYESQKYLSLTRHVYSPHIAVANLKWFEDLPETDRKLIRQCMQEAALYQKRWNRKNMADFLENLKRSGMIVDETPDVKSFRNRWQFSPESAPRKKGLIHTARQGICLLRMQFTWTGWMSFFDRDLHYAAIKNVNPSQLLQLLPAGLFNALDQ